MKIVAISDTHCRHKQVEIPECDLLIHAGDITGRGEVSVLQNFLGWLDDQPATHKVIIPGNHDYCFQQARNIPRVQAALAEHPDIICLQDSEVTIEGLKIYGSPWQPWFYDWAFNFPRNDGGKMARETWAKIPDDTDILITHGPPHGILDRVDNPGQRENPHVGCKWLISRIDELDKLRLHVAGHIHEGYGLQERNGVTHINASICTLEYKPTNNPVVIDL
jgi:Icc-related predicted phosphoesterase